MNKIEEKAGSNVKREQTRKNYGRWYVPEKNWAKHSKINQSILEEREIADEDLEKLKSNFYDLVNKRLY